MLPDLEHVLELNAIDADIHRLKRRKQNLPAETEKIGQWMEGEKHSAEALQARIAELEKESRSLDVDVAEAKEKKQKSEDRLMHISTNAEYDAVHGEIETAKRNIAKIEERMLQIMSELEQLSPQRKAAQEKLESPEMRSKEADLDTLRKELSAMESEIAGKEALRQEAMKKIGTRTLRLYEKLHKAKNNGKCVGVVSDARRVCGSCAVKLTPQKFINVKKGDTLQTCESCGSILVWQKG